MACARRQIAMGILCAMLALPLFAFAFAEQTDETDAEPAVTCLGNDVPITAETRDEATAAGYPKTAPCWNPKDPNTGYAAGEAKKYLRSLVCLAAGDRDNYGGAGPDETITKLNAGFAVCAAKFLRYASPKTPGQIALQGGGSAPICIREGYRTNAKQMEYWQRYMDPYKACNPTGKLCEHTTGMAIDVNVGTNNYAPLFDMAPQFGVFFYLGSKDPYHFAARTQNCITAGTRTGDPDPQVGGGVLPPGAYDFPRSLTTNPFQDPNTQFLSTLPQLIAPLVQSLGSGQAAPAASPLGPITPSPVIAPTTNPITSTTQNPLSSSGSGTGTGSVPNPLSIPDGGSSVSIAPSSGIPTAPLTIANPTSQSGTKTGSKALSPLALIELLAGLNPNDTITAGSSSATTHINDDLADVTTPGIGSVNTTATMPAQTFVSSDLSQSPSMPTLTTTNTIEVSRLSSMLTQLRGGLETLVTLSATPREARQIGIWTPVPTTSVR